MVHNSNSMERVLCIYFLSWIALPNVAKFLSWSDALRTRTQYVLTVMVNVL